MPKKIDNIKNANEEINKAQRQMTNSAKNNYYVTQYDANEQNARVTTHLMEVAQLGECDMSMPKIVEQRVYDYLSLCIKNGMTPNIAGLAIALNTSTKGIEGIHDRHARYSEAVSKIVDRAYQFCEAAAMGNAIDGRMNPIVYCFNMRNNFNYQNSDKPITHSINPLGEIKSVEQLREKYGDMDDD